MPRRAHELANGGSGSCPGSRGQSRARQPELQQARPKDPFDFLSVLQPLALGPLSTCLPGLENSAWLPSPAWPMTRTTAAASARWPEHRSGYDYVIASRAQAKAKASPGRLTVRRHSESIPLTRRQRSDRQVGLRRSGHSLGRSGTPLSLRGVGCRHHRPGPQRCRRVPVPLPPRPVHRGKATPGGQRDGGAAIRGCGQDLRDQGSGAGGLRLEHAPVRRRGG